MQLLHSKQLLRRYNIFSLRVFKEQGVYPLVGSIKSKNSSALPLKNMTMEVETGVVRNHKPPEVKVGNLTGNQPLKHNELLSMKSKLNIMLNQGRHKLSEIWNLGKDCDTSSAEPSSQLSLLSGNLTDSCVEVKDMDLEADKAVSKPSGRDETSSHLSVSKEDSLTKSSDCPGKLSPLTPFTDRAFTVSTPKDPSSTCLAQDCSAGIQETRLGVQALETEMTLSQKTFPAPIKPLLTPLKGNSEEIQNPANL